MEPNIRHIDLGGVNCYLAETEKGFVLFDTGGHLSMDKDFDNRRKRLLAALDNAGCHPGRLQLIVLTHGDSDHCANVCFLREMFRVPVAMHPADRRLVETPSLDDWLENFRFLSVVFRLMSLVMGGPIRRITAKALAEFEPFKADVFIEEGSSLSGFGLDVQVLHLPGHTRGSIAILFPDGSLIVGDTLANGKKPGMAINAWDFRALRQSLDRLRTLSIQMVYPGHGQPFSYAALS